MDLGWVLNERQHAGNEHLDADSAARFDEKLPFDPTAEVNGLRELGLSEAETVIDFGTGTGVFPLAIADHCERVIAIDVSESMISLVEERLEAASVRNVDTVHDGFLSYDHEGPSASFAFSKDALHHLPDFWKVEALKNVGSTLEPGGIFRLRDFVFSFDPRDSRETIEAWIAEKRGSTSFTDEEIDVHFREEFSTYGFLLEAMLEAAGFDILEATYPDDFYAAYNCEWRGEEASC